MKINNYHIKENHGTVHLDQRIVKINVTVNINETPKVNVKKKNSPLKKYFGWVSNLAKGILTFLTLNSQANQ